MEVRRIGSKGKDEEREEGGGGRNRKKDTYTASLSSDLLIIYPFQIIC